jgi:ketosteroid isomerase-like protein
MKKKTVWQIGVLVLAVVAVVGCATSGKGPSDQELVKALLGSWKGAIIEKNADKILATYADDFTHDGPDYQAADKAGLRKFVAECDQAGYFDGVTISFDNAPTAIQGNAATISGIQFTNNQGSVTVEMTAKKGKTGWLIANMSIEGM